MSNALPQLVTVDPATLQVNDQVRGDATPDDALVDSVRRNGVLQPPIVARNDDGDLVIVMGHRRVGAAITAGLTEITVIERAAMTDDAERIEDQIVENERRKGLSARELAQGYQQLELFGRTPADIAAALAEKPERIRAGLRITKSQTVSELVEADASIDLEQAAQIADFDEHPKLQRKLIETATARPENFARDLVQFTTERTVADHVSALKKQLDDEDTLLADVRPYGGSYWTGKDQFKTGTGNTLANLVDADGAPITNTAHRDCAGHAAIIDNTSPHYSGDPEIIYVCTDWKANGHQPVSGRGAARERSPEEIEREAEFERARAARAEKQQLIEANARARRSWIHGYVTTGRLRPIASHFDVMADATALLIEFEEGFALGVLLELLTGEPTPSSANWYEHQDAIVALLKSGAVPSYRFALSSAIAVFEDAPDRAQGVKYFAALESWGYTLTDTDRDLLAVAQENALRVDGEDLDGDPRDEDEEPGE